MNENTKTNHEVHFKNWWNLFINKNFIIVRSSTYISQKKLTENFL